MRVAALFDIHGNLPALEAVLDEVRRSGIDRIVVGGDVVAGPMSRESLQLLLALETPVDFIHGNCDLAILAIRDAANEDAVTYWGTTSGAPLPARFRPGFRQSARDLLPEQAAVIARWPKTLRLEIDGLGGVLFCHGTPRSETEIFTRITPADRLEPLFDGLDASVVVCGHTHMQFDRQVGRTRVVNAGSVGEPFGMPGAHWVVLGPDVEMRRTSYDLAQAAERIRATGYPLAQEFIQGLRQPPFEAEMLALYTPWELK